MSIFRSSRHKSMFMHDLAIPFEAEPRVDLTTRNDATLIPRRARIKLRAGGTIPGRDLPAFPGPARTVLG
jgi:hypothetical protein